MVQVMSKKRRAYKIFNKLRSIDALIAHGMPVSEAAQSANMSEMTYYRWRKRYAGFTKEQFQWVMALQDENAQLRREVVGLQLDRLILMPVSRATLLTLPRRISGRRGKPP
jgi:putative transposase